MFSPYPYFQFCFYRRNPVLLPAQNYVIDFPTHHPLGMELSLWQHKVTSFSLKSQDDIPAW